MKRETICLIIACLISFILTAGIMNWRMEIVHAELSDTQQSLAKEVFRFHVIAESDSANDQRIKLKVRDAVLKYMKAHMTRAERRDAKATKAWTLTHKKELTDTADKILKKEKVSYRAKAEVTTCYFPDKRYGDIIFPEGNYEALRIVLGKGNGHNWWCVLYPNLCFTNATCAVVDEDGKKELKERFALIYTGQRRLARNLLRDVVGGYIGSRPESLKALKEMKAIAVLMRFALEQGDIDEFAELLNQHWKLSCMLDAGTTNTCIDQILLVCEDLIDGKFISGAGGGGFIQVILKKDVTKEQLHERLHGVFQDSGVDVWDCELLV